LAQDVSAFHNIDAEAELTALLSEQIAAEVDREILRDLRKGAAWKAKWDYNEWKYGGNAGATLQGYTQKDWNQTLVTKINDLENKLEKYRPKTPQEKLELRSLDSGPFQQKLSDFFVDKQEEMEKSGKNEYVLTTDDVEDFSNNQIEGTFNTYDEEEIKKMR
jgi:hypothetical protein